MSGSPDANDKPVPSWGALRSFGRTKSRTLKPRQAALFESLLPNIQVPDPRNGPIDPKTLMPPAKQVWLELGFGGGEHLAEQAARHPDTLMIGAEPFLNGVGSALRHIDDRQLENVRLHPDDGRPILFTLPDRSLDRVMILFPDPWPKTRHHKRRLIQPDIAEEIARTLKPGGQLRFVTDWKAYAAWALDVLRRTEGLIWSATQADDWRVGPADHVTTRYEEKRLGDTPPIFLDFTKP